MKKTVTITTALAFVMVGGFLLSQAASAVGIYDACSTDPNNIVCANSSESVDPVIKTVIRYLLIISGIVSVVMVIIGGLKYSTSNGDSAKLSSAKNTILYAIIGVIISALAYGIVDYVFRSVVQ
jgi:hypothetical protein cdiviTM7_00647